MKIYLIWLVGIMVFHKQHLYRMY